MCKEGIRIGQNTEHKATVVDTDSAAGTQIVGPDADRISFVATLLVNGGFSLNEWVSIGVATGGGFLHLCSLTAYAPTAVVRIEDLGDSVREALVISQASNASAQLSLGTVRLRTPLKDI